MKKNNLLFTALVLLFFTVQNAFSQDAVYNDLDRTGWTSQAPPYSPTDNAVGINGDIAGAKYLLDNNSKTFLALVKPGKTYGGVTGPASLEDLWFTVDLGSAQTFNYFRINFRSDNTYDFLRPWEVSIYVSNGTEVDPADRNWTLLSDISGNNRIKLPNAEGSGKDRTSGNLELDITGTYTSVKVVYTGMSASTSGSTLQVGEFFLGKVSYDKVIHKPADLGFGDVQQGASVTKTLTVTGTNISSDITYQKGNEEDAAAFTITPGSWTSRGGTATVTFAPTVKKAYSATLTINSTDILEAQTITLSGNADFEMPVQISSVDNSDEHWYYLQFTRQAKEAKVLSASVAGQLGDTIKQMRLESGNQGQMWKITGTWDHYSLVNKSGQAMKYAYTPVSENPVTGIKIPEVISYILQEKDSADQFGFVRYLTKNTWQLQNTTTTLAPAGKIYLNDFSGVKAGGYLLNNSGNELKFIDAMTPDIVLPGDSVALGSARQYTTDTLKVMIGSVLLTNAISAEITADEDDVFSLHTASLSATGGELELIYTPDSYKKISYASIKLTSGGISRTFVVSATSNTGMSKYYVGTTEQWGTPADGEIVASIPVLKSGDVVWIAEGEFTTATVSVPTGVSIYGSFSGTEGSPELRSVGSKAWEFTHPTILKNSSSLIFSVTGSNTIIDGITFEGTATAGRAIQNTTNTALKSVIRNSVMKNFNSAADGGALNIRYETEIYNCLITNNTANKGGAGYLDQVVIHDCEITNNSVPTTAEKPIGSQNGGGGALLLAPSGAGCRAYNLYISGNTASFGGGAFVRGGSKLYNSIIVNNIAKSGSGIVFDERDNNPSVYNVTIANNRSTTSAGSGICFAADAESRTQMLYNAILWNNTDLYNEIYNIGVNQSGVGKATPVLKNLIIDDLEFYVGENANLAITDGIAVKDSTVLFAENWHTSSTSPGLEKGMLQLAPERVDTATQEIIPALLLEFSTGKDFAGHWRVAATIDIGPYEDQAIIDGVKETALIDGQVVKTVYYNLQGVEIKMPAIAGIYIKKEILDNQKIRVTKILHSPGNF